MSMEYAEDIDKESPQSVARSKLACETCRANKVKCVRVGDETSTCNRCRRYRLECTVPSLIRRRGRPPGSTSTNKRVPRPILSPTPQPREFFNLNYTHDAGVNSLPRTSDGSMSGYPQDIGGAGPSRMSVDQGHFGSAYDSRRSTLDLGHPPNALQTHMNMSSTRDDPAVSPTSKSLVGGNPNLDVSDYLDPGDRVFRTNASTPKVPFYQNYPAKHPSDAPAGFSEEEQASLSDGDDPINLRILSISEAGYLIDLFHERLNLLCAVLDPKLHDLRYLRSTSTLLFTSVLSAASKFFRKDLHAWLLSHAQTLLNRAICSGVVNLGTIQSLQLLVYFKLPDDTSAWFKIGMAIRWGYQLYLHEKRVKPLPSDVQAARRVVNLERSWFLLYCFDRGYSQTFGLPTSIRLNHIGDAEAWARGHTYLGPTPDMHLACSIELCKIKDHWLTIFETSNPSIEFVEATIDTIGMELENLWRKWFDEQDPPPQFEQKKELGIVWSILDFMLIVRRHQLELSPNDTFRQHACLDIACRIVDNMERLSETGGLAYLQDTASTMTSSLGVLLRKMFRKANPAHKALIINLLQRILVSHTRILGEETNTAPAYVARFIRRLLGAINDESWLESRAPSPRPRDEGHPINGTQAAPPVPEQVPPFLEDLNAFLSLSEHTVRGGDDDSQFWAQLLSAGPAPSDNPNVSAFNDMVLDWGMATETPAI